MWQDQIADFPDQRLVLSELAKDDDGMAEEQIIDELGLSAERIDGALQALVKRDLIAEADGCWRLVMPLFKRWLQLHAGDLGNGVG